MYIGNKICLNLLVYCLLFIGVSAQVSRELLFHSDTVDLTCHACNASHFCKYGHRYKCPEHSSAPDPSASTIEECICVSGYLRVGDHCNLGTPPYYYQDGLQFSCGNNRVTVTAGASLKSQCVCPPGTEGEPGGDVACPGCAADFYNEQYNASCVQCAVHSSHSQTKSRNATDCLCDAGFTGPNGGPCTACAAGSFKAGAGSAACTLCEADEYSLSAAATCESCHANSSSEAGSDELADCECNAGFSGADGGPCVLCAVGKFKDSIANEACSDCLDNSFSEFEGATSCVSCLDSSAHSTGRDRCLCNAGYTQADTVDTRPDCTPCAANTYQAGSGETSCFECDANANGPEASATPVTCFCNAGFYDTGDHTCDSCAAGAYKEAAVSAETDELECVSCPANSHSPMQSVVVTDCVCNAGFDGPDGGACTACLAGKFKAANGSAACAECTPNFFSDTSASTACESCVEFLNSDGAKTFASASDSSNDCVCDLGLGYVEIRDQYNARTCTGCQAGTFATADGCANCTNGQFSDVAGLTVCKDCPANSSSYDYPHVACQCHAGYLCAPDGGNQSESCPSGNCFACPIGTFKDYTGGAAACDVCQNNSVSDLASVSQADCECDLGYRQDGPDMCVACLAGHYTDTLDSATCTECGDRYYTEQSDFPWTSFAECTQCEVCNTATNAAYDDHYDNANNGAGCGLGAPSECVACPADTSLFQPSTEDNWNAGVHSCKCVADFYGSAGGPCNACPANSIRNFSDSSSSISDCVCDTGFEPDPAAAHECTACPVNTYKTGPGNYNCTPCAATMVTEFEASIDIDNCVCQPGYYFDSIDGSSCIICGAGSYKPGYNRDQSCTDCRNHSISEAGSEAGYDCKCILGFEVYLDAAIVDANRLLRVGNGRFLQNTESQPWRTPNPLVSCSFLRNFYESETGVYKSCDQLPSPYVISYPGPPSSWSGYSPPHKFSLPVGTSNWLTPTLRQLMLTGWFGGKNNAITGASAGQYIYNQYLIKHPDLQCASCVPGKFKNLVVNEFCTDCAINAFTSGYEQHSCASCAAGKSTVGLLGQTYCECDAGTERESSNVLSDCQDCAEGKFKTDASYDEPNCQNCSHCGADQQVDTVCDRFQDIACKACQDNSWSSVGRTELGQCFCNAGYELVGSECVVCDIGESRSTNVNNSIACKTCADGTFSDTIGSQYCELCTSYCNITISQGNTTFQTYVADECDATKDIICATCSACPPGQYANQSCGLNFDYDRSDTECVLCPAGFYCPGGVEGAGVDVQPIVCPDNALSAPGSDEEADCSCNPGYYRLENVCTLCEYDVYCPGSGVTIACPAHSITRHRRSSQRLDCHCLAGFYRNPADEAQFNCSLCTPNDYCYNNSLYNCSDSRMLAEPGSSSPADCVCMDGFYNDGAACTECAADHFCVGGTQTACVANEWTNGQTGQAECLCRPGLARGVGGRQYVVAASNARCHYTQSLSQTTLEECKEVCTNQLCAGFYYYSEFLNLGFGPTLTSLCGICAFPEHFVNGTVGESDTDATSVLDPQLLTFFNGTEITGQHDTYALLPVTTCGTCTEDFFCDGSDDAEHACPADSVSAAGSSSLSDCLCVAGFEHVHPVNASEPHTCHSCVAGATFKTAIGNHECGQCTVCSASIDFVFQGVACAPTHDATCIPCTVCSQTGDRYETSPCQDFVDTQCAACQQCNFTTHFISQECFELSNRECTAIAYDLQCADGQYAGGHTTHTQTRCLPCRYNDTLYVGAHLHVGGSPGRVYNDPYSCKSACLSFSRLRNTEAHYLGCETCETGNVLFKVFSQDPSDVECRFTCLPGFEKSRNSTDCTLGALSASDQNFAHHFVNVSRIDRPATLGDDASGFTLTVVHTQHSRFVVVVGAGEPTCTGRESRVVADDCCYSNLWRVSQTTQMGLPVNASEHCSKAPLLPAARLDDTTLSFALPDRRLQEVASCVEDNGRLDCTLTVSIVDLILFTTYSVPVHVSRVGSTMLAAAGQEHRYVPLSKLRVEVYVAFVTDAGVVLMVTTDLQASGHALNVSVHGIGLVETDEEEDLRACARHSIGTASEESSHRVLQIGEAAAFSTFLLSPGGLPASCTLRYTLDLGADSVMQVAVWRNLSLQSVLCVASPELSVNAGTVQISHGLGAAAIYNRVVLPTPESTIYGRLGMLSTLVATATLKHVTQVQLTALLAAHALPSAQHLLKNTTSLHDGVLDFRPEFRSACRATATCDYQYLQYDPLRRGMFLFSDCSATTQALAKAWIKQVLGVPHDDGHVAAICEAASNGPPFLAALVNTHAYLNSLHAQWNFFQDWTAPTSKTALFALFKFV